MGGDGLGPQRTREIRLRSGPAPHRADALYADGLAWHGAGRMCAEEVPGDERVYTRVPALVCRCSPPPVCVFFLNFNINWVVFFCAQVHGVRIFPAWKLYGKVRRECPTASVV